MNETILLFLVLIVLAFIFSAVMSQIPLLRIPSSISYLVFGILLQKSPIQLPAEELRWVGHLGDIGLLFLMFLSGLEVDVRWLKGHKKNQNQTSSTKLDGASLAEPSPLTTALLIFTGTLLLSFGASWLISFVAHGRVQPYMLTLLLSTTSLGVIVPVLEEKGILHAAFGQTLLLCALIADVVTMLLVSLYVNVQTSGKLLEFFLALAIIPGGAGLYTTIRWVQSTRWRKQIAGDRSARLRGVVAMVAAGCALADYTGSEPILGSFLIGVVISAIPMAFQSEIRAYCHGLGYGLLVPMFFLSVGLNFRLDAFTNLSIWKWTLLLIVLAFLVKLIPTLTLRHQFGLRQTVAAGFLLSTRLSLVVAAADIAVTIGALPQYLGDAFTLTAMVTCLVSPILFLFLTPRTPSHPR